jgi:hypothetical protein
VATWSGRIGSRAAKHAYVSRPPTTWICAEIAARRAGADAPMSRSRSKLRPRLIASSTRSMRRWRRRLDSKTQRWQHAGREDDRLFQHTGLARDIFLAESSGERSYRPPKDYTRAVDALLEHIVVCSLDQPNLTYAALFCYRQSSRASTSSFRVTLVCSTRS